MKKVGKINIFSPLGKEYAYFPPINLKFTKLHPLIIINLIWVKNMNQEWGGRGQKYEFKILYKPLPPSERFANTSVRIPKPLQPAF